MSLSSELEYYQHLQKYSLIAISAFAILAAIATYAWNFSGVKIKEIEAKQKVLQPKDEKVTPTQITENHTYHIQGDLVRGNKKVVKTIKPTTIPPAPVVNVTSYNQQGGITAHQVNIGSMPRILGESEKRSLLDRIEKDANIEIQAMFGDAESQNHALEIMNFLKNSGYTNVKPDLTFVQPNKPIFGKTVDILDDDGKDILITVGHKKLIR